MAVRVSVPGWALDVPPVGRKKASPKVSADLARLLVSESDLHQVLMQVLMEECSELAREQEKREKMLKELVHVKNFEYIDVPERFSQQVVLYRQFRMLTNAVKVCGVSLFISMSLLLVSTALGLAGMYLSLALALAFLYGFWLETKVPILNPRHMALGLVALLGLAATSIATLLPF